MSRPPQSATRLAISPAGGHDSTSAAAITPGSWTVYDLVTSSPSGADSRWFSWTATETGAVGLDQFLTVTEGDSFGATFHVDAHEGSPTGPLTESFGGNLVLRVTEGTSYYFRAYILQGFTQTWWLTVRMSPLVAPSAWVQPPDRDVETYINPDWLAVNPDVSYTNVGTPDATHQPRDPDSYVTQGFTGRFQYDAGFSGPDPWDVGATLSTEWLGQTMDGALFSHAITSYDNGFAWATDDGGSTYDGEPVLNPSNPDADFNVDGGPTGNQTVGVTLSSHDGSFGIPSTLIMDHYMTAQAISFFDEARAAGPAVGYTTAELESMAGVTGTLELESDLPEVLDVAVLPDWGGNAEDPDRVPGLIEWLVGPTRGAVYDAGSDTWHAREGWGPYSRGSDATGSTPYTPAWESGGGAALPSDMLVPLPAVGGDPAALQFREVVTYDPSTTPSDWVPVDTDIVTVAASQEAADLSELVAAGLDPEGLAARSGIVGLQLVCAWKPAMVTRTPGEGGSSLPPGFVSGATMPSDGEQTGEVGLARVICWTKITFRPSRFRVFPVPPIIDPGTSFPLRRFPRDDGQATSSARRIWPPPKPRRIYGGYR